jgi:hypothetical protein
MANSSQQFPRRDWRQSRSGRTKLTDRNHLAVNELGAVVIVRRPRPAGVVESRCGAVDLGSAYRVPALSVAGVSLASPWLRFHIPLIKPGGPFSGTRLSDKALRHLLLHTFAHEQLPLRSLEPV